MIHMFKSLAIFTAVAGGAFLTQPAKADHVSISLGIPVPTVRVYAPPVYVAPRVTTVYAAPSYGYTTTYYSAPTYYAPSYYPPTVVYSSPVVVSAPVYCPPPVYVEPFVSSRIFLPLPSFSIGFGFGGGGGHHGHR